MTLYRVTTHENADLSHHLGDYNNFVIAKTIAEWYQAQESNAFVYKQVDNEWILITKDMEKDEL